MATRGKGSRWAPEWSTLTDPVTGATIHQLTDYYCHSNHLYFTEQGWYEGGRKLLFISQRENRDNLFGVDLTNGEITQLTDLDPIKGDTGGKVSLNPLRDEAIFYHGDKMIALDLQSLEEHILYVRPKGFVRGGTNVTADGKYVCTYHVQDLSDRVDDPGYREYMAGRKGGSSGGFQKLVWEARPRSMIVKIALEGSGSEVVLAEDCYYGHVNTSPTLSNIITYCHEGPWKLVDNRIWGLDLSTGQLWKIRPNAPGEAVGHEYWMSDGEHIGYHGRTPNGPIYGAIRYDNTDRVEAPFTYGSTHFHSLSLDLVVGDGSRDDPYLLLWRFRDGRFEGPKALVWHRGSFHAGHIHVHPRFSSDGKQIVYTADPQGYAQVFVVDVPDFEALPDRSSLTG